MASHLPHAEDLPLATREGLPEELLLLLREHPRDGWPVHRDFNGLAAFWLDRHLSFRHAMDGLRADAEAVIDGRTDPQGWGQRLVRLGSAFLGDLAGHHQIEDEAYFPRLAKLEPRIARGFEVLDRDHHDLHALIDRFASAANHALAQTGDRARRDAAARFLPEVIAFERMLARHLTDEEDLVLPIVLEHRVG